MQTIRAITSALVVLAVSLGAASAQIYNWTTIAGLAGQPGSEDGTNAVARFRRPQGLAADYDGTLYVADTGNSTIRKISPVGSNWVTTTLAGLAGNPGSADGTNSAARFNGCAGLALDSDRGVLYVADTLNHTIRMMTGLGTNWYTLQGTNWVVSTIAGQAGLAGSDDGTNSAARFFNPSGIAYAIDSGRRDVFVADTGNSTVRMITLVGTNCVVRTLAGLAGSLGSADGTNSAARFQSPCALAVRTQTVPPLPPGFIDFVFVTDTGNSTLREFDFEGPYIVDVFNVRTLAGMAGEVGGVDGTNNAARFDHPSAIAVAWWSNPYVVDRDNHTIRVLTPAGTNWVVSTIGGLAGQPGFADGPNSAARFSSPEGVAVDGYGRVFVADTQNQVIRMGVLVPPPAFQSVTQTNGILYFTWSAVSGCFYQVQYQTNLTLGHWSLLISDVRATGSTVTVSAALGPDPQRFYRVVLWP